MASKQQQGQQVGKAYAGMDGQEDAARRLQEAMRSVEESAFHMNRAVDANNLDEAIKQAVKMLRELRVGILSPKSYYELWMKIFDHLRQLHAYFLEVNKGGLPMADLYQKVQATNHIIPRLYLMITVGSAFIIRQEAPTKDVLQDLIEMSKGVQHPMRGLFLRNYLLKMTQDKLSSEFDASTDFSVSYVLQNFGEMNRLWVRMQHQGNAKNRARREKERQDLKVLISFNLVRLSEFEGMSVTVYKSTVLDRILDLVTSCKDRIAQQYLLDVLVQVFPATYHLATLDKLFASFEHLEAGVDLKAILISIMERLKYTEEDDEEDEEVESGDAQAAAISTPEPTPVAIAQAGSGDSALDAKAEGVDALLADGEVEAQSAGDGDAVAEAVAEAPTAAGEVVVDNGRVPAAAFTRLNECIKKIMSQRNDTTAEDVLDLQIALLDFVVACYPGQLDYIDNVLGFCAEYLEDPAKQQQQPQQSPNVVDTLVVQLLKVPLRQEELGSVDLLGLSHFPALMERLSWESKKKVAFGFLQHVLAEAGLVLDSEETATKLLAFISPLIKDDEDAATDGHDAGASAFEEQQGAVAKLVSRFGGADSSTLFKILGVARKHFGKGGVKRIRYTLVPLCFRYLMLADRLVSEAAEGGASPLSAEGEAAAAADEDDDDMARMVRQQQSGAVSVRKVFQYVHETCSALAGVVVLQDVALRMFLQAALSADRAGEQEVAYEFMAQAFTLYEEIADSKEQLRTLPLLVGTLQSTTVFDKESYETLITKTTQYAARLLKKTDQCKMVLTCSHLFWALEPRRELREGEEPPAAGQDSKRALECLKRSLKIADSCVASSLHVSLFVEILNRYIYFFEKGMDKITAQNVTDLVTLIQGNLADVPGDDDEKVSMEAFFQKTLQHLRAVKSKHAGNDKFAALAV